MSRIHKLLQRLERLPSDFRFDELRTILESHGFVVRGIRGSHHVFVHDLIEENICFPKRTPVKIVYLKKALRALRELELKEAEINDEQSNPPTGLGV